MARANLNLKQEVIDAFVNAQDDRNVRLIIVQIRDEDLALDVTVARVGSPQEDFSQLLSQNFRDDAASFGLFRVSDESTSGPQWALIAWVPDGCRVRDKMLYTSSREDLKRGLGLGYFKCEYSANARNDFDWKLFTDSQTRTNTVDILSETERLVLEEKTLTQAEIGSSKSSALGVIPFAVHENVHSAWVDYTQGRVNWVSLTLSGETIQLESTNTVSADQDLNSIARSDIARYVPV
jgi:twinfilin-like protein